MCLCVREGSAHRFSLLGQSSICKDHRGHTLTFLTAQRHMSLCSDLLSGPCTSLTSGLTEKTFSTVYISVCVVTPLDSQALIKESTLNCM